MIGLHGHDRQAEAFAESSVVNLDAEGFRPIDQIDREHDWLTEIEQLRREI